MATYYYDAGASGANNGSSKTDAYQTFAAALAGASSDGDIILASHQSTETLTADTTFSAANNISIICINFSDDSLAEMDGTNYYIGHASTNYSIQIGGAYKIYQRGMAYKISGGGNDSFSIGYLDGCHLESELCKFWLLTSASGSTIRFGNSGVLNNFNRVKNCDFQFGNTGQGFVHQGGGLVIEGGQVNSGGSVPANLWQGPGTGTYPGSKSIEGFDMSVCSGNIVGDHTSFGEHYPFSYCKLHASAVVLASQTVGNLGGASAVVYDCASGDEHFHMGDYNAFGQTTLDSGIYNDSSYTYDGSNRVSAKIVTTANCSTATPYYSPWFSIPNEATSAITPYLEILRDGSTTAFQDDEVWLEVAAKTTTGSVLVSYFNDRMTLLGTPADQEAGAGLGSWTGESGTAWSGKLTLPSSITPAEIGAIRWRVGVGVASTTVYVDTLLRGV